MTLEHLILLVEEPSMEAFLHQLLPRIVRTASFETHSFQGKPDLLGKLGSRLRSYRTWLPDTWKIVVVVDRDADDCGVLKRQLEEAATNSGFGTLTTSNGGAYHVINRLAVEELEAWYFGEWNAVLAAFPRISSSVPRQRRYRHPDAVQGGTWEAFERFLKAAGYHTSGLRKIEAARAIAEHFEPSRSRSHSFRVFHEALQRVGAR